MTFSVWGQESLEIAEETQMTFTEVVESEPMKGALGSPKWVVFQRTSDGLEVRVPKGIFHSQTRDLDTGGWAVLLYIPGENVRSQQDSSSSSPEPLV